MKTPPVKPSRPLRRAMPPAEPYLVAALGDVLSPAAEAIHDKTQAPISIVAQAVLGAAALAVQGHADVILSTGQARPCALFLVSVAASGERKTSAILEAVTPTRTLARLRAEAVAILESTNAVRGIIRVRDEIVAILESTNVVRGINRVRDEVVAVLEGSDAVRGLIRVRDEAVALFESFVPARVLVRLHAERPGSLWRAGWR